MRTSKPVAFGVALLAVPAVSEATYGKHGPAEMETIGWIIAMAVTSSVVGKRILNRVSAVFLGGVGGTLAAGMWHNLTGGALGLLIGVIVAALPWFRKPMRSVEAGSPATIVDVREDFGSSRRRGQNS